MYNSFIDKKSLYVQHIQTVFVLLLSVKRGVCTYVSPWITQQELPLRLRCQQLQRLQNPLEQPQRQEPLLLLRALQSQRQTQCFSVVLLPHDANDTAAITAANATNFFIFFSFLNGLNNLNLFVLLTMQK